MKRFFFWIVVVIFGVGFASAAGLAWHTRDRPATHTSLRNQDLTHLISVRDFFADTKGEWNYKPSYDGSFIAWRGTRGTQEVTFFGKVGENPLGWIKDARGFTWNDVSNHLMVVLDGRLWKVDPLESDRNNWIDVTPRGFSNWNWPSRVKTAEDRWVITSRDRNPAFSDLYTTKQDGSDKQILVENGGQTLAWVLSKDLQPQLRLQRTESGKFTIVEVPEGDDWRVLLTVPLMTSFRIFELTEDATEAYALSARNRDKTALVRFDLSTGEETVVYQEADEDVLNILNFDPHDGHIDAVLPQRGGSEVVGLSPRGKALASLVATHGDRVEVDRVRWAGEGRFVTATLSPEALNYTYHLFDLDEVTQTTLGEFSFRQKHVAAIAETTEVLITARDGIELPSLLVRPKGVTGPVPTVIEVHGGPASHLHWGYHHFRQFLANRGYAVLAVNFRGSTGFGKSFQAAGFGAYGRAMQNDLIDAARWAVDQGIADPNALAINGGSYGGYASAMAVLSEENLFSAAIVEHAMLDVAYQSNFPPHRWGLNLPMWHQYFGDPKDEAAASAMQEYSPINRVEHLSTPLLLVAGKRDRVVGFEQTENFVRKAEDLGHDVEVLIFEDEGHGLNKWQSNVRHARRVEDFLHKHLGGRTGGNSLIEIAADILD